MPSLRRLHFTSNVIRPSSNPSRPSPTSSGHFDVELVLCRGECPVENEGLRAAAGVKVGCPARSPSFLPACGGRRRRIRSRICQGVRSTEVVVPFSSIRLPAAGAAAFMAAAAVAGVPYVTGAQAAQPVVQRAAPIQRAAPVQRVAPQVFTPRPAPQVHINRPVQVAPRFTQPQNANRNFQAVNPSLQRVNPNVRLNNPSLPHVNPNLAQPKVGLPLQGGNGLKLGPGKPNFNPVLLKPGGPQQIKPFVPVGLLGGALIGGSYWYREGCESIVAAACTGFTPDGWQLHWRMVDFEDG